MPFYTYLTYISRFSYLIEKTDKNLEKNQENKSEKKVGRNEKCPCGSGKKFKHCHGNV